MALTLRDDFGDIIKWKAILIVEVVLLVVFGSMVFPQIVSDLFEQEPVQSVNNNVNPNPPTSSGATGDEFFLGVVMERSVECGGNLLCVIIMDDRDGDYYLVGYSPRFGRFFEEDIISGRGEIQREELTIIAGKVQIVLLDMPGFSVEEEQ